MRRPEKNGLRGTVQPVNGRVREPLSETSVSSVRLGQRRRRKGVKSPIVKCGFFLGFNGWMGKAC